MNTNLLSGYTIDELKRRIAKTEKLIAAGKFPNGNPIPAKVLEMHQISVQNMKAEIERRAALKAHLANHPRAE